ncbi:helix-turn-helix transcriptional regulator [Tianweitania sediminis]|uniref:Helix-turn-helix transcriptional regulator n=1 Tax=Tianweitania sediminis TaxID=1502156 RepID=A0A8J7RQW7_9HYPH|nr:helix-turn-helix transcriptional regulator [Tianweitania sediminis]
MSQRKLGETLGVTFQQIQKYERGMNRIAVTTLVRAAAVLDAPLSFFLEGIGPQRQEPERPTLYGRDARLAQALAGIEDRRVRAAVRTLVRALSTERQP